MDSFARVIDANDCTCGNWPDRSNARLRGEKDAEASTMPRASAALGPDRSTMFRHNSLAYPQSKAGPLLPFGSKEGME